MINKWFYIKDCDFPELIGRWGRCVDYNEEFKEFELDIPDFGIMQYDHFDVVSFEEWEGE